MKTQKLTYLLLTILIGIILLIPFVDLQPLIAPGDHGHDLYSYKKILDGQIPYRDFWWVYGPLMPYVYALFYKILGISIHSVLIGKFVITLYCGIIMYFAMLRITRPSFAFLASIWFFAHNKDFFFTYNHIGGIAALITFIYFLFSYIQNPKAKYIYLSCLSIFILNFIKINFGACALFVLLTTFTLSIWLKHKPKEISAKRIYITAIGILPLTTLIIYSLFVFDQPIYIIRQCFPYLSDDHPHRQSVFFTSRILIKSIFRNIFSNIPNMIFAFIIWIATFDFAKNLIFKKVTSQQAKQYVLIVFSLSLLYIVNLHEFIASGVPYRTFWSRPFSIMLIFFLIGLTTKNLNKIIQFCFAAIILYMTTVQFTESMSMVFYFKNKNSYLNIDRGKIYHTNPHPWNSETIATVKYIKENLAEDELFFALPYDPIYYFFTDKTSPTRQLIFFDHINIPKEQELQTISDLESKNVNWILLSSRYNAPHEPGLGILGETCCPLIGKYIKDNFKEVKRFGDWRNPAGWAWPHGTVLLKRK